MFFQLSAEVTPEVEVEVSHVSIKLPHTSVKIHNNRRKLITKFFKTPVTAVKVQRAGKNVVIRLDLRWPAQPQWHFEVGGNGYQVLVVEFSDVEREQGVPPTPPSSAQTPGEGEAFLPNQ